MSDPNMYMASLVIISAHQQQNIVLLCSALGLLSSARRASRGLLKDGVLVATLRIFPFVTFGIIFLLAIGAKWLLGEIVPADLQDFSKIQDVFQGLFWEQLKGLGWAALAGLLSILIDRRMERGNE